MADGNDAVATAVTAEAARRQSFAVISHPDAGKSTLTEAPALHARVITEAGAVHGKSGRRGVVSDWMEMEQARGIYHFGRAAVRLRRLCGQSARHSRVCRLLRGSRQGRVAVEP